MPPGRCTAPHLCATTSWRERGALAAVDVAHRRVACLKGCLMSAGMGPSTAPPLPEAASALRTFLIADLRGYTRFTQEQGDEAAARLAARFAALMREGVDAHGGQVRELRGDEALAVFASPRQAMRAAVAVQASFAEAMAANPGLPLTVGMGLDAGEAVPVEGGYRGGALNRASRLCAVAPAGEVLVTEALAHLAGAVQGLAYLERGRMPLRGLAEPVRVLQLLPVPFVAVVAAPADGAALEGLLADLRAHGVACWNTQHALETEDGASGLREGVRACRVVLCVRTPQAGQAWPVKGVLEIAQLYRRPVVTAWVAGDGPEEAEPDGTWPESVDMIDLRGERYAAALPRFVAHLTQVAGRQENVDTIDLRGEHYAEVAPRNPYKGLRAFQEEDAGDFFGRKRLVAELLAAVRTYTQPGATRFLAVVGPSGSGKSSVVLAGLLPQLRGGAVPGSARWVYLAPLVPAAHPLEALSIALNNALPQSSLTAIRADLEGSKRGLHLLAGRLVSHPEARVVLVVDQAEEIFTL